MDKVTFTINGEQFSLRGADVLPDTSLNDYLRTALGLHGTKAMCHEGGCGACIVSAEIPHPVSKDKVVVGVNSCLVNILSCHQWNITTVEGIGNRKDGYHPIQSRLASFNGTQCGYCTPGWVMNMYSLQKKYKTLSMKEVENSFAGNICRCTGYRPILDAFKSFANDVSDDLKNKLHDLEDIHELKCLRKREASCSNEDWCVIDTHPETLITLENRGNKWYKAFKLEDVFSILRTEGSNDYRFVNGNTGRGVFPIQKDSRVLIDISSITGLKEPRFDANLILGAGMTLTEVMEQFQKWAEEKEDFKYLDHFYKHLDLVAHVPVRNIGTIGGNLAMKNQHNDFPSDVFLLFESVGATTTILHKDMTKTEIQLKELLKYDLTEKLILNIKLPPISSKCLMRTYKIMPRAQNAHAIMNAAFLLEFDKDNKIKSSNIVFGAINPNFTYANDTQTIIKGRDLFSDETIKMALNSLNNELFPEEVAPEPSPFCKKMIALGLFYKAILSLSPKDKLNKRYVSGGSIFDRPISKGTQTFDTDKSVWPLNKPMPKLEALHQCSGEAVYADDALSSKRDVHVAFVLSTIHKGDIESIDTSSVLKTAGVVAVFTAKDIPGNNSYSPTNVPWQEFDREILATKVEHYGQPIAIVAAITRKLAMKIAKEVKVKYANVSKDKPVLCVDDALKAKDAKERIRQESEIKPTDKGEDTTKVIKGKFTIPSQYHYTMETQSCRARVSEIGLEVVSSTQWMDLVNVAIAQMLGIQENQVNVTVKRVGGGYGGKATPSSLIACACALVAYKTNRPARFVMSLTDNMAVVGKRQPCDHLFEIGINDAGVIQYLNLEYLSDSGYTFSDIPKYIGDLCTNFYSSSRWHITGKSIRTDKPINTWCRAPGTTEANSIMEHIMERIAFATKKDSSETKLLNLSPNHNSLKDMIIEFKNETKYDERKEEISKFNNDNAWKKRSIKLATMCFPIEYSGNFSVTISVYHADGTVAISHAGIEMGQGINTKVAQVCAYKLNIPLEKVSVKYSNNMVSPNAMASNGSLTSDLVSFATVKACEELLNRFHEVRDDLTDPTWEEIVKTAYDKGINLQASYMYSPKDDLQGYKVYGVAVIEIELDVLTGQHQVLRVDLIEDTGRSMSPDVDVGQIEGAFVMGMGLWTSEHLVFDKDNGRLLTDRTWTYKPPGVKDIPLDFRISFKRNSLNPTGVLRSKATGEPALTMSVVLVHALQDAIIEARKEFGYKDEEWLHIDTPYTVDNIITAISPKIEYYKLK